MEDKQDIEIGDVESFSSGKDQNYSRSASIMRQTNKVQDDLSREMKPGFFEIRRDKFGNELKTLSDDTRKRACESIETLKNTLQCDFDEEAKKEVEAISKSIIDKRTELVRLENDEWNKTYDSNKVSMMKKGLGHQPGLLHRDKRFSEMFILFSLEKHREMFESLIRLGKREDFYKGESFEG